MCRSGSDTVSVQKWSRLHLISQESHFSLVKFRSYTFTWRKLHCFTNQGTSCQWTQHQTCVRHWTKRDVGGDSEEPGCHCCAVRYLKCSLTWTAAKCNVTLTDVTEINTDMMLHNSTTSLTSLEMFFYIYHKDIKTELLSVCKNVLNVDVLMTRNSCWTHLLIENCIN